MDSEPRKFEGWHIIGRGWRKYQADCLESEGATFAAEYSDECTHMIGSTIEAEKRNLIHLSDSFPLFDSVWLEWLRKVLLDRDFDRARPFVAFWSKHFLKDASLLGGMDYSGQPFTIEDGMSRYPMKDCCFDGCDIEEISSDLEGCSFKGATVKQFDVLVGGTKKINGFNRSFVLCPTVKSCDFSDAVLEGLILATVEDTGFQRTRFVSPVQTETPGRDEEARCRWEFAYLRGLSRSPREVHQWCDFSTCDFQAARFERVDVEACSFVNCEMAGVVFQDVLLSDVRFKGTNLQNAQFESCMLHAATFEDCKLEGVRFKDCLLFGELPDGVELENSRSVPVAAALDELDYVTSQSARIEAWLYVPIDEADAPAAKKLEDERWKKIRAGVSRKELGYDPRATTAALRCEFLFRGAARPPAEDWPENAIPNPNRYKVTFGSRNIRCTRMSAQVLRFAREFPDFDADVELEHCKTSKSPVKGKAFAALFLLALREALGESVWEGKPKGD